MHVAVRTPKVLLLLVWPLPLSLATTNGISVDVSSSRYLDVSVPGVPHVTLWIHVTFHDSSPWEFPHSEIRGYNAYLQLPTAYRSLSRPSSAPDAKAFTLRSCSLELPFVWLYDHTWFSFFELSEFLTELFRSGFQYWLFTLWKDFFRLLHFVFWVPPFGEIVFSLTILERHQ